MTNDKFLFGKYKDTLIKECKDIDYIKFYYNSIYDEHKEYVGNVLSKLKVNTQSYSSENLAYQHEVIELIKKEKWIDCKPERNLNKNGEVEVSGGVILKFLDYQIYRHGEYEYALPIIRGHGRRIKNKELKIKGLSYTKTKHKLVVKVNYFSIVS